MYILLAFLITFVVGAFIEVLTFLCFKQNTTFSDAVRFFKNNPKMLIAPIFGYLLLVLVVYIILIKIYA